MSTLNGHTDAYWNGSLSMTIALALKADEKEGKRILKRTLTEFLDHPLPSEELKQLLRKELDA